MSTTCSQVVQRAVAMNPLNASLANDPVEMLARIDQQQTRIFTAVAAVSKDRFQTTATVTSSAGASGRVLDCSALTPPLERLLTVHFPDGRQGSQVDIMDLDAEYAPRFIARGLTLVEVGSDWSSTSSALACPIVYVYGATPITTTGGLSQTVTLPDAWTDLLVKPLAAYLNIKDIGRGQEEYQQLQAEYQSDWAAFVEYLTHVSGPVTRRFDIPAPPLPTKR